MTPYLAKEIFHSFTEQLAHVLEETIYPICFLRLMPTAFREHTEVHIPSSVLFNLKLVGNSHFSAILTSWYMSGKSGTG